MRSFLHFLSAADLLLTVDMDGRIVGYGIVDPFGIGQIQAHATVGDVDAHGIIHDRVVGAVDIDGIQL